MNNIIYGNIISLLINLKNKHRIYKLKKKISSNIINVSTDVQFALIKTISIHKLILNLMMMLTKMIYNLILQRKKEN
jgi:hypothetical protein